MSRRWDADPHSLSGGAVLAWRRLSTTLLLVLFGVLGIAGSTEAQSAVTAVSTGPSVAPILNSLSPRFAVPGTPEVSLTVRGENFGGSSTVHFGGAPRPTTLVSPGVLNATIPGSDVTTRGRASVKVVNADGRQSNELAFIIGTILDVPSGGSFPSVSAPASFSVLVTGSAFVPGSTILLNGSPLPTIYLGESAVTGDIVFNPGDVPRTATVTVETPGASASSAVVLEFFTTTIGAVLPSSRSVAVDSPATAFATLINAGGQTAKNCGLSAPSQPSLSVSFQTTDPMTNRPTGEPNALIDIPSGGSQSFIVSVRSSQPFAPRDVALAHRCSNNDQVSSGLDALLFSASATPVADIVALAATLSNNGIVDVAGPTGTGVFAVATVNVGASELITASADTGPVGLPIAITVCQTDPALGICLAPAAATATAQIDAGATPTFGIFVRGGATVPFDPAGHRIYVRFRDPSGVTRGSTSVAVRTQ